MLKAKDVWGRMISNPKQSSRQTVISLFGKDTVVKRKRGKIKVNLESLEKGEFRRMVLHDIQQLYGDSDIVKGTNSCCSIFYML